MAEMKKIITTKIILELDAREARMLKDVIQNPPTGDDGVRDTLGEIFNLLKEALDAQNLRTT